MELSYSRNDKIISRKFFQYLLPTVLMVVMMQIGSLADGIIVGNMLGADALSATSLSLPLIFLAQLPGMTFASGGAIVLANLLAKRKIEEGSKVFKVTCLLAFLISLVFIPVGIFASRPIATALAGNFIELIDMMDQYIKIFLLCSPIFGVSLAVCYLLPSDNNPNLSAVFFILVNVFHIGFEILFCIILPKEVVIYGVGGSMGIGMLAGLLTLIPYARSKGKLVQLKTPIKGGFVFTKDLIKAGSVSMALMFVSIIYYTVLNIAATQFLHHEAEMSLFAMLSNFIFVIDLFITGVIQILPSVVGALFGDKDYYGIRVVTKRVLLISMIVTVALMGISIAFPQLFFIIFGVDVASVEAGYATLGGMGPLNIVRIYCISFLIYTLNKFITTYYPSILINGPSLVNVIAKNGIVGPLIEYFLLMGIGVLGHAIGAIVMEASALILTLLFIFILRRAHKYSGSPLLLLPKDTIEQSLDITIPARKEEITLAVEQIQRHSLEISKDEQASMMMAVASEEVISNVMEYGYQKRRTPGYIDINLSKAEDRLRIRIRDDGVAFDPTEIDAADEDFSFHGIEVIKKVSSDFKYLRILNTNNVIMEVKIS